MNTACKFCQIVQGQLAAHLVLEDDASVAFLDHRPLFPGHTLLVPRRHCQTLSDLAEELVPALFSNARLLARAIEKAMNAEGSFVAINNRVSQSVPHLHVHVVPRRHKDGLRGFFWPRQKYESPEAAARVAEAIRQAIRSLRDAGE